MLIAVLFILDLFILALLIFHSYAYRGLRFTTNFYILGLLWIFTRYTAHIPRVFLHNKGIPSLKPISTVSLITSGVWLTILYIGWTLAERTIKRVKYFRENLFAVLLLSILIITSISYCIEITLMYIGWWPLPHKYTISGLVNDNSGFILEAWFFFNRFFLLAFPIFFIVECSKFRRADWKCLLILLPFIYGWVFSYFAYLGPLRRNLFISIDMVLFGILFILSLACSLHLEYCNEGTLYKKLNSNILYLLDNIPFFMMLLILLIIFIIDIFVLKQPSILISTIPAIFFVLLYFEKIPIWFLTVLSLPFIILWEQRFILNIIPIAFILILKSLNFIKERKS